MEWVNKFSTTVIAVILFGWVIVQITAWHYDVAKVLNTLQQIHIQERAGK